MSHRIIGEIDFKYHNVIYDDINRKNFGNKSKSLLIVYFSLAIIYDDDGDNWCTNNTMINESII